MRTRSHSVALIVFDEVELLDAAAPLQVLSLAGRSWNFRPYKVQVIAPSAGFVLTRNQLRIEATAALSQAALAEIVWVAGGYGARRLARDAEALGDISRLVRGATLVAAVGSGSALLAAAGCIGGQRVAGNAELAVLLHEFAPNVQLSDRQRVVQDGQLFTAGASGAAIELALAVVAHTMGAKLSAKVAAELGLDAREATQAPERIELKY